MSPELPGNVVLTGPIMVHCVSACGRTVADHADWGGHRITDGSFERTTARHLRIRFLKGCSMRNSTLPDLDARQAVLAGSSFDSSMMQRANLSCADLRGASFRSADLNGADLTGADIRGADFTDADLRGANLTNAACQHANIIGAKLDGQTRLPSPQALLSMHWGHVDGDLCASMMRFDAASHPGGCEPFTHWADEDSGDCPYAGHSCRVERAASFCEESSSFNASEPVPDSWPLAARVLLAKCKMPAGITTVDGLSGLFWNEPDKERDWEVRMTRTVIIERSESTTACVRASSEEEASEMAVNDQHEWDWDNDDEDEIETRDVEVDSAELA